jgi:hypothetical protein
MVDKLASVLTSIPCSVRAYLSFLDSVHLLKLRLIHLRETYTYLRPNISQIIFKENN